MHIQASGQPWSGHLIVECSALPAYPSRIKKGEINKHKQVHSKTNAAFRQIFLKSYQKTMQFSKGSSVQESRNDSKEHFPGSRKIKELLRIQLRTQTQHFTDIVSPESKPSSKRNMLTFA